MENSGNNNASNNGASHNEEEEQLCAHVMQLVTSSSMPAVLHTICQLGVFEIIAKAGPGKQLSPSEIAAQLPTKNTEAAYMLDRMLRLLTSYSVFTCSINAEGQRIYGLAPVAKYLVGKESFGGYLALHQDRVFTDLWHELKDAVLEGGLPFDRVHGTHLFDYLGKDPRFNDVFNNAMINYTTIFVKKIVETYKGFEGIKQLVDVGGNLGACLSIITSKYPSIKGINFDMPHVIKHAPSYPGVEHVGGNMFESVPNGDAIFMKWILHDWGDDYCLKLLKNCYKALPDNGKVIVADSIFPEIPDPSPAVKYIASSDILLMAQDPGGKERTEEQFLALAKGAGFKGIKKECLVFNVWVMEFFK